MQTNMIQHLHQVILPFWKNLKDEKNGGYIGFVDKDLNPRPDWERGCILNSRILWFFSEAVCTLGDESLLPYAHHAYDMLLRMTDKENGGVYWSVKPDGTVADATKHTYNIAFAIYALSTYYQASGRKEALENAMELFRVIEEKCTDDVSYVEASTADFRPLSNDKLSENGVMADKTMNTLLHLLEAYTELYRVGRNEQVKGRLYFIMDLLENKLYNPEKHRLEVFFDRHYNSLLDMHSYGHDVETSWLADRTLEILDDEALTARIRPILMDLARETYRVACSDHGFSNECVRGQVDTNRIWWVQAEAIVGFLNAYEKTGEIHYLEACRSIWRFTERYVADSRPGSEWFWMVDENGKPISNHGIVEPWKCPYHNGRMMFEVVRRQAGKEL